VIARRQSEDGILATVLRKLRSIEAGDYLRGTVQVGALKIGQVTITAMEDDDGNINLMASAAGRTAVNIGTIPPAS
jgi:hypothetical protein